MNTVTTTDGSVAIDGWLVRQDEEEHTCTIFLPSDGITHSSTAGVQLAIAYCRAHHDVGIDPDQWDLQFFANLDAQQIVDITTAAHYLRVRPLIDLLTHEIASTIMGRPGLLRYL